MHIVKDTEFFEEANKMIIRKEKKLYISLSTENGTYPLNWNSWMEQKLKSYLKINFLV